MSIRKKIIVNTTLVCVAIAPIVLYAYEYGPDPGYTAAPGDNQTGCMANGCHTDKPNSASGSVKITASGGTTYVPGQTQQIQVTISDSAMRVFGFELSARVDSNAKLMGAGTLASTDANTDIINCKSAGYVPYATACPSGNTLQWISHNLTGYTASKNTSGSYTYKFNWTPPSTNVGTVTLYAAGNAGSGALIVSNTHTYLNSLQLSPSAGGGSTPTVTGVVSDATFAAGGPIASGSWVAVFGSNLATDTRQVGSGDIVNGSLPTTMDGTSATVDGKAAFIGYISATQINIQVPDDPNAAGMVPVVVTTAAGSSTAVMANLQKYSPGLFPSGQGSYVAAQHGDGSYVGGYTGSTPAKPGETIVLWATGLGPASPAVPAGQVITAAPAAPGNISGVTVTIGGQTVTPVYAGKTISGDDQVNVTVPSSLSNGDQPVVLSIGGVSSQSGAVIAVHN